MRERADWMKEMNWVALPVLKALAKGELGQVMPGAENRPSACLEALGRTLCGIAPWLELDKGISVQEGKMQKDWRLLARAAIACAVDPASPGYLGFDTMQNIVDAAFLCEGILRAPRELWEKLEPAVQNNLIAALKKTRVGRKPSRNNWLLFSALIEAALCRMGCGDFDRMRIDYALVKHSDWYVGDGMYADGEKFHMDYYNSFVITPMLVDLLETVGECDPDWAKERPGVLARASRYAALLERQIMPDGRFPLYGRSLCYRTGCFHALAQAALQHRLPQELAPGAVRSALTAVIQRLLTGKENFDERGFLVPGFSGRQPDLAEPYITTGSLYLCCAVFLPLGLPEEDPFWSSQPQPFTSMRVWSGDETVKADHAIDG